jgi:uncharacterized protein YjbI with pentapeptide repeats
MIMSKKIDATTELFKGKLTGAAVKTGAKMISKWEADLKEAEFTGAKTIHADLVKLRRHLEGDELDGATIGGLLVKLGGSTGRAATQAKGNNVGKLESLGQTLVKVGESLGG